MHRDFQNRDGGLIDHLQVEGSTAVSLPQSGPLPGDAISIGDIAALVVADAITMRFIDMDMRPVLAGQNIPDGRVGDAIFSS